MLIFCVKNETLQIMSDKFWKPWTVLGGWMEAKAGLRIAYSNQKSQVKCFFYNADFH